MNKLIEKNCKIGDVYMMRFSGNRSEQSGWRPGVVFQNNIGNIHSPNIIALPMTRSIKKACQPTHVIISSEDTEIMYDSMVLAENPQRMSKENIGNYITTLSGEYMSKIAEAYLLASSAISFINPEALMAIWQKAVKLNA